MLLGQRLLTYPEDNLVLESEDRFPPESYAYIYIINTTPVLNKSHIINKEILRFLIQLNGERMRKASEMRQKEEALCINLKCWRRMNFVRVYFHLARRTMLAGLHNFLKTSNIQILFYFTIIDRLLS